MLFFSNPPTPQPSHYPEAFQPVSLNVGEFQLPHRVAYSQVKCAGVSIYKRELFDVKHQLMLKDSLTSTEKILLGATKEDLRSNEYEGGLKCWECSSDLICLLANENDYSSVLELGAGTALPGICMLLKSIAASRSLRMVLCDYNRNVLELVTLPNVVINWALNVLSQTELRDLQRRPDGFVPPAVPGELELTPRLLQSFASDLDKRQISLSFIAGGWSPKFSSLLKSPFELVLASETIYSPKVIPEFCQVLLDSLAHDGKAFVAAKKIYFGVGGSVAEFLDIIGNRARVSEVFGPPGKGRVVLQVLPVQ